MSSLDNAISQAAADIDSVKEVSAGIEGTKSSCDEVVSAGHSVGVEHLVAGGESMKNKLEQMQSGLDGVASELEGVQAQAEAMKSGD